VRPRIVRNGATSSSSRWSTREGVEAPAMPSRCSRSPCDRPGRRLTLGRFTRRSGLVTLRQTFADCCQSWADAVRPADPKRGAPRGWLLPPALKDTSAPGPVSNFFQVPIFRNAGLPRKWRLPMRESERNSTRTLSNYRRDALWKT
jgi:hypothetical protein